MVDEPPPSYESAIATNSPPEAPPTYQSIFGDLQRVKKESNSVLEFFKNLAIFFFSTIGFFVCLALFLAIPVACIIIGVQYKDDCKIQPKIPLYLIVLGVFCIFRNLLCLYDKGKKRLCDRDSTNEDEGVKKTGCSGITDVFLFSWFICGNIWVYGSSEPRYFDPDSSYYCDKTLYLFAFWLNTSVFILFGTLCCCFATVGCCVAVFANSDE